MITFLQKELLRAPQDDLGAPPIEEAAPAENTGPDLSFIPEDYHTDGAPDAAKFGAHYQDMIATQAQNSERMAQVPEDASGYEFGLPEDIDYGELDLPEDFKLEMDTADPAYQELGGWLKEHGVPSTAVGGLMGVFGKYLAGQYSKGYVAQKAEMDSLGSADARISSIERKLDAKLPEEQAAALKDMASTAAGIKALENLLSPAGHHAPTPAPTAKAPEGLHGAALLDWVNKQEQTQTRRQKR